MKINANGQFYPIDVVASNAAEDREKREMADIEAETRLHQSLRQSGMPEPMVDTIVSQVRAFRAQAHEEVSDNVEELRKRRRENLGYEHAGKYMEFQGANFVLYDFEDMMERAKRIIRDGNDVMVTYYDHINERLLGSVAAAFIRYLYFVGIAEAIMGRAECPACHCPEEPQFCDRCGGLGWVVQDLPADDDSNRSRKIVDAEFIDDPPVGGAE